MSPPTKYTCGPNERVHYGRGIDSKQCHPGWNSNESAAIEQGGRFYSGLSKCYSGFVRFPRRRPLRFNMALDLAPKILSNFGPQSSSLGLFGLTQHSDLPNRSCADDLEPFVLLPDLLPEL